ncbi:MAG TPA: response regulator [Candidatus Nanoarchaeia archaeon]|nr:response regulator [Candidatus Nanoarchaeia archaeon]
MPKTIMIVDDELHMVELEKAILEADGFKTISAYSGDEALKLLEKHKPDLVILDMMMPDMSGREVCEKIRKNPKTKNLRVVFVTVARFSEIGKEQLKGMNVLDYINKPFDNDELVERIKKALVK